MNSSKGTSVPRPFRNEQTVRDIFSRVVVPIHRGCGGPREVVMQQASDLELVPRPTSLAPDQNKRSPAGASLQCGPVATANPARQSLITVVIGVRRWPIKVLPPSTRQDARYARVGCGEIGFCDLVFLFTRSALSSRSDPRLIPRGMRYLSGITKVWMLP